MGQMMVKNGINTHDMIVYGDNLCIRAGKYQHVTAEL